MDIYIDPNIYQISDCDIENDEKVHFIFFSEFIDFLIKVNKENNDVCFTENEYSELMNPSMPPWISYKDLNLRNLFVLQYNKFLKLKIRFFNEVDLNVKLKCGDIKIYEERMLVLIRNIVNEIQNNKYEYALFLGKVNSMSFSIGENCNDVFMIEYDNKDYDIKVIKNFNENHFNNTLRKLKSTLYIYDGNPSLNNPLPYCEFCKDLYDIQNTLISNGENKYDVFEKIGEEVALRNTYMFDARVTKLNNNTEHKRKIYRSSSDPTIFISIDFEKGCFELFNHSGVHQGEIKYDGNVNSKADKTGRHNIIVK